MVLLYYFEHLVDFSSLLFSCLFFFSLSSFSPPVPVDFFPLVTRCPSCSLSFCGGGVSSTFPKWSLMEVSQMSVKGNWKEWTTLQGIEEWQRRAAVTNSGCHLHQLGRIEYYRLGRGWEESYNGREPRGEGYMHLHHRHPSVWIMSFTKFSLQLDNRLWKKCSKTYINMSAGGSRQVL